MLLATHSLFNSIACYLYSDTSGSQHYYFAIESALPDHCVTPRLLTTR